MFVFAVSQKCTHIWRAFPSESPFHVNYAFEGPTQFLSLSLPLVHSNMPCPNMVGKLERLFHSTSKKGYQATIRNDSEKKLQKPFFILSFFLHNT